MALRLSGTSCLSEAYVPTAQNSSWLRSAVFSYREARCVPLTDCTYRKARIQSHKWRQVTLFSQSYTCKGLLVRFSQQRSQESCHTQCLAKHSTSEQNSSSHAVPNGHSSEIAVARTAVRLAAKLCFQGLPNQPLCLIADRDFALLRAPQSAPIAASILAQVNVVLSDEPGYRAATDAEFADLIWGGLTHGGPEGRFWIMNPIDGLEGFEKLRQYGVSMALQEHGKVGLAALACPNLPLEPIVAMDDKMEDFSMNGVCIGQRETAEAPSVVSHQQLQESVDPKSRGCLFMAVEGEGAFQAALYAEDVQAPENQVKLPIRPFFPPHPDHTPTWAFRHPQDGTFALVSSYESRYENPGQPQAQTIHPPVCCLALDGQVQYGALARGDAKVLLMGGQDHIWDHAAGMLIAQESGFQVTNGEGAALDFSLGIALNCHSGVIATHPVWHDSVLETVCVGTNA